MAATVYECMYILDSNKYARDQGGVTGKLGTMVEKCGGETLASRLWNEQKLAYPINGHRKGTYWLTFFRMDSSRLSEFNRECQLNSQVLRHLVLKVEPRLVDTLVAHARGELPGGETAERSEAPAASKDGKDKDSKDKDSKDKDSKASKDKEAAPAGAGAGDTTASAGEAK